MTLSRRILPEFALNNHAIRSGKTGDDPVMRSMMRTGQNQAFYKGKEKKEYFVVDYES
ncbi:MAG: hypothetical protein Q3M24_06095 [Candidatus Electrothrix aestuarii]|uniref:Uncharacterized protein n=1 Tax=Candidatus Electrothrix aestuarii TaxID=3062594 RepID=A0AAU8LXP0_9BACT|nr:hypothetical protein [Candidatus Electrothrix aestuarii]